MQTMQTAKYWRRCGQAIVMFLVSFIIIYHFDTGYILICKYLGFVHLKFGIVIQAALSTMLVRSIGFATALLALSNSFANAHGSHASEQNPSSDWATRHMQGSSLHRRHSIGNRH